MSDMGYVVVRLPQYVGEFYNDRPRAFYNCRGERIEYGGVDRDPWKDLSDAYYDNCLLLHDRNLWEEITRSPMLSYSPGVCSDLNKANVVLDISNKNSKKNELILLKAYSGVNRIDLTENTYDFMGIDCYVDGYGSILRLGLYNDPDVFHESKEIVNENGLFKSINHLIYYIESYHKRCYAANLEPIHQLTAEKLYFLVYRVLAQP